MGNEAEIELAKRRVAEADERCARQYASVRRLQDAGRDATEREKLLSECRSALQDARSRLLQLQTDGG